MEVIQGADALILQNGKPEVITISAPKPWPGHPVPTRQKWRVVLGEKGNQKIWLGDQGSYVWGERNKEVEDTLITFEERKGSSPYDKPVPLHTKIDKLVQELVAKKD